MLQLVHLIMILPLMSVNQLHFPINTSNDSCFTSFDIHGLTSHPLSTCQMVEALQPSLMVISGPHYLDKPSEYGQINCLS